MRPIRLMYLILLSALIVAACGTPNSVQIPVTQGATLPAPTIAAPLIAVPGLASIQMIDARNGWAITDTTVVRSDDGGVSWHKVGPAAVTSLGFSATSDFLDALHGWFLISDTKNPAVGMLYWTSDGGVTWTSADVPVPRRAPPLPGFNQDMHIPPACAGARPLGWGIFSSNH